MIQSSNSSIVTQFTIYVDSTTLCKLFIMLSNYRINISAAFLSNSNNNLKQFKFVVGEDAYQSPNDIKTTIDILNQMKLRFNESKVVKSNVQDVPGVLAIQYCALIKGTTVYDFYLAEDGSIIYEVCCPVQTIKILNSL